MSDESSPPDLPAETPPPPPPSQIPAVAPQQQPVYPIPATGPYHPSDDERTMGMLIHLLALLTGWIGVLILWLIKRESSRFIDHNGKEAINFQISVVLYSICFMIFGAILAFATEGMGLAVVIPLYLVFIIMIYVFEIMSCIKANRGEWIRYPLTIRLIK